MARWARPCFLCSRLSALRQPAWSFGGTAVDVMKGQQGGTFLFAPNFPVLEMAASPASPRHCPWQDLAPGESAALQG